MRFGRSRLRKGATIVTETKHPAVVTDNGPLFNSPPSIPAHSTYSTALHVSATVRPDLYTVQEPNRYDRAFTKDLTWDRFNGASFEKYSWSPKEIALSWESNHRRVEIKKAGENLLVHFVEGVTYDDEAILCYAFKVMNLPPEHVED